MLTIARGGAQGTARAYVSTGLRRVAPATPTTVLTVVRCYSQKGEARGNRCHDLHCSDLRRLCHAARMSCRLHIMQE